MHLGLVEPLIAECTLLHPFIGQDHAQVQMPRGASRLGGARSSHAARCDHRGGLGIGVSLRPELLGGRRWCKAVMLDDEDIEAIADRVAVKLRPSTGQKNASQPDTWERAGRRRNQALAGTSSKRLKGLEPSTFCMAADAESTDGPTSPCKLRQTTGSAQTGSVPDFAAFRRGSVHQLSTENRADRASRASSALRLPGYEQSAPRCCPFPRCGSGTDSDRPPADARCSFAAVAPRTGLGRSHLGERERRGGRRGVLAGSHGCRRDPRPASGDERGVAVHSRKTLAA